MESAAPIVIALTKKLTELVMVVVLAVTRLIAVG
jgi:hypothetical protein